VCTVPSDFVIAYDYIHADPIQAGSVICPRLIIYPYCTGTKVTGSSIYIYICWPIIFLDDTIISILETPVILVNLKKQDV